ncbi:tetratricopeptide repeat protein [Ideonella azotifigens]|uniref:Tetratricopeptide repeat protein n=2 Tax=Ideonella azotifigens TaxID=513160 RepID=A0ABN1KHK6_9BURK|nr:tetratricopeptide repeat protein [Ideonella azotifigens]MCD2344206.1 tetratricopeptide repeat protein [Ideonella azotifigens]
MRWPAALALATLLATQGARAEGLRDPQLQALADAHKLVELEQAATTRLAAHPDDGPAWLAYLESVVGRNVPDAAARRDAALAKFEACVQKTPQVAACHYGVGAVTAINILAQGIMKAAFGVGKVRDEFAKALELDPAFAPARAGLVQYYLMVPGIVGGSVAKASEIAQAESARAAEYGKLLTAMVQLYRTKLADAERLLASVQPGGDLELAVELRGQWNALGLALLQDRQAAKARELFERMVHERPEQPGPHYSLARALSELQQWDAALAELKLAESLPGHENFPIDYRVGVALQGKGDTTQARAAYKRYLGSVNPNPQNVEDIKKRLAELG